MTPNFLYWLRCRVAEPNDLASAVSLDAPCLVGGNLRLGSGRIRRRRCCHEERAAISAGPKPCRRASWVSRQLSRSPSCAPYSDAAWARGSADAEPEANSFPFQYALLLLEVPWSSRSSSVDASAATEVTGQAGPSLLLGPPGTLSNSGFQSRPSIRRTVRGCCGSAPVAEVPFASWTPLPMGCWLRLSAGLTAAKITWNNKHERTSQQDDVALFIVIIADASTFEIECSATYED